MPLVRRSDPAQGAPADIQVDFVTLIADLANEYPQLRRSAARRLGRMPHAANLLCAALVAESQTSVREAIFNALICIGTRQVAHGLIPLLQSDDPGLRNGAVEALKTMPDAVGESIGEILAGSADVRLFGVDILGELAHPDSQQWLLRILDEDDNVNVCAAAVGSLAECGDARALPALAGVLARFPDEPFLAFSVRITRTRIENAE